MSYNDAMDFTFAKGSKKEGGGDFSENGGPLLYGNKLKTCLNLYTSNSLIPPELLQLKKSTLKKKTLPDYLQGLQFTLLLIDLSAPAALALHSDPF